MSKTASEYFFASKYSGVESVRTRAMNPVFSPVTEAAPRVVMQTKVFHARKNFPIVFTTA
jgi:hypothetical protein